MMRSDLLSDIITYLKDCGNFSDIRFTEEYPYFYKESPLKKITVSVGLEESAVTDISIGNVVSIENGTPIYGRQSEYRVCLAIHVPFTMDGIKGIEVFTKILDELVLESDFNIVKAGSRHMHSSRDMGAKVLECWFTLKDVYTISETEDDAGEDET